jgi:hypothetical protein
MLSRMTSTRGELPPRLLPILYFAVAHAAFALAALAVAVDPRGVSGFFYHARMLGIVHLVTLGWITSSILGALYIVGPVALRTSIPATRPAYAAFALYFAGSFFPALSSEIGRKNTAVTRPTTSASKG